MATASFPPETTTEANFQELILQRKAERLEYLKKKKEKLEKNLRRIKKMKSKTGIHPLALFPKEIWLEIMEKFNPKDKWNMYQIHPAFQDLLESRKIQDTLFPQTLAVILSQIRNDQDYGDGMYSKITGDDVTKSDLLPFIKLRQVCKSLRNAVDCWFENEHIQALHNYSKPDSDEPEDAQNCDTREAEDRGRLTNMTFEMCPTRGSSSGKTRVNGLTENFRKSEDVVSAKKFFLRSISVVISALEFDWRPGRGRDFNFDLDAVFEDGEDLWDMMQRAAYTLEYNDFKPYIIRLLELIGDQIWYFKLNVDPLDSYREGLRIDVVNHFIMLHQCCELMPNLKRLDISFYSQDRIIHPFPRERIIFPRNIFETYPFPKLEKLERLNLEQGSIFGTTLSVYNAILEANPQIKMLSFLGKSAAFEGISSEAMKALQLESFMFGNDMNNSIPCTFDFTVWKAILQDFTWPLKSLQFRVKSIESINQVFQFLERFPTLETIAMHLGYTKIGGGDGGLGFLVLPNLTDLQIAMFPKIDYANASMKTEGIDIFQFFSLHFLLYSKKLQYLFWTTCKKNEDLESTRIHFEDKKLLRFLKNQECHEKMINYRGGMRDLTHSNVWDAFPELEYLVVDSIVSSEHLSIGKSSRMTTEYRRLHLEIEKTSDIDFSSTDGF